MSEVSQTTLERHRSPSASQIYTNARSYLIDNSDHKVQSLEKPDDDTDKGNSSGSRSSHGTSADSTHHSRSGKDRILKKPTRHRSQSSDSVIEPSSIRGKSVSLTSSKKPPLDRPRADNFPNCKEVERSVPCNKEKSSNKRQHDKTSKISSPSDSTKNVVPPLSLSPSPEVLRSNSSKSSKLKSSNKKLVSRSINVENIKFDSEGSRRCQSPLSSSGNVSSHDESNIALLTTPPRHLNDDLSHSSMNGDRTKTNSSGQAKSASHKDVKDLSSNKGARKSAVEKLKAVSSTGGSSCSASPLPFESGHCSRSDSGESFSQQGESDGHVDKTDDKKLSRDVSAEENVATAESTVIVSRSDKPVNPFASKSSSSSTSMGKRDEPSSQERNIFECRFQEAQALNRKDNTNGAVMYQFSLWKNFSKNSTSNIDAKDDENKCDVAPAKKTDDSNNPNLNAKNDEAIDNGDFDLENADRANSKSIRIGTKAKTTVLAPVSGAVSSLRGKTTRKSAINTKKNKNKIDPILQSNKQDASISMSPPDSRSGAFELEDEHGHMQEYRVQAAGAPLAKIHPSQSCSPSLGENNAANTTPNTGGGKGMATNFRSMVGSCQRTSDADSLNSEDHCSEVTDVLPMHRSVSDSIASFDSSIHTNYEREGFEEDVELAIYGVALNDSEEDDTELSFVSEDATCFGKATIECKERQQKVVVCEPVQRALQLEGSIDSSVQDGDSLLLSASKSHDFEGTAENFVPFSPRALDDPSALESMPPPIVKVKTTREVEFSAPSDHEESISVDQSCELLSAGDDYHQHQHQSSTYSGNKNGGNKQQQQQKLTTLKVPSPLQCSVASKDSDGTSKGSVSARLPQQKEGSSRRDGQTEHSFNSLTSSTCLMSATLGSPPPLRKANLQAKQSIKSKFKENNDTNPSKKEARKSRRKPKSDASSGNPKSRLTTALLAEANVPTLDLSTSLSGQDIDQMENDAASICSQLSEVSETSGDEALDVNDPFPMTKQDKEYLRHRESQSRLGEFGKRAALTAPAALETSTQHITSVEQEKDAVSRVIEANEDQNMHSLGNGSHWKKGNDVLGEGSFGQVFKGMNNDTGELLAVKQICLNDGTESEVNSLRKEIDVMKDLKHPNIVRYIGTSISSRYLFIILEYVPGGSVAGTLKQFGAFSEALIRRFVSQIITGVGYLHEKKIIHRDIKGGNVLVSDTGIAKLADFGCSKQLGGMVTASLEESMRIIRGSVPWMAPEVIKQVGHGRSADIWSVGATMIEMATAKHPWPEFSNNLAALFHVATSKDPPPVPAHLSDMCSSFMMRCLVIDPKGRATAAELKEDPFLKAAA